MRQALEAVPVRTLLVSDEIEAIEILCSVAQRIAIRVETCCDTDSAMRKLCQNKFEGVLVDLGLHGGIDFLRKLRTLTSNRSCVSYAILGQAHERTDAFKAGANFVLERPLIGTDVVRVLKASYPLMVRERRRYFRYPVQFAITVSRAGRNDVNVTSMNVSENGICMNSGERLEVGDKIAMKFCLPGSSDLLKVSGEVCWSEESGRVGIQFGATSPDVVTLREWLAQRVEEQLVHQSREPV